MAGTILRAMAIPEDEMAARIRRLYEAMNRRQLAT
jgi:hypothetical protein